MVVLCPSEASRDVKVEFEEAIMSGTLVRHITQYIAMWPFWPQTGLQLTLLFLLLPFTSTSLPPSLPPSISPSQELITSKDITISINPQDALPTVSIEDCEDVHLHYYEPRAIGGIYTVKCRNIVVHLQPPHQPEQVLDLPEDNLGQYVSMLRGGKMATVQAIRGRNTLCKNVLFLPS